MKQRLIGGFFVSIVTLVMLFAGGIISALILTFVSLFGLYEYLKLYSLEKSSFAVVDFIGTILLYILMYFNLESFLFPTIIGMIMILLAIYVIRFPHHDDMDVTRAFFGFFYVTVLLSYVYRVRSMEAGLLLACFILISSWGNDVFAYLVGNAIGKHKFSPKVSPNKSVEGFFESCLENTSFLKL